MKKYYTISFFKKEISIDENEKNILMNSIMNANQQDLIVFKDCLLNIKSMIITRDYEKEENYRIYQVQEERKRLKTELQNLRLNCQECEKTTLRIIPCTTHQGEQDYIQQNKKLDDNYYKRCYFCEEFACMCDTNKALLIE